MSARRVAALLVVLAAAVALWLVTEARAGATEPFRLSQQVTNTERALTPQGVAEVTADLDDLYNARKVRLFVVYVDDFSGLSSTDWARKTWDATGLGGGDALLAVAITSPSSADLVVPPNMVSAEQYNVIIGDVAKSLGEGGGYGDIAGAAEAAARDLVYFNASPAASASDPPTVEPLTDASPPASSPHSSSSSGSLGNKLTRVVFGMLTGLAVLWLAGRGKPRSHWSHHRGLGAGAMLAGAAVFLIPGLFSALLWLAVLGALGWAAWWWLRGRSADGGNAKLRARVETALRLSEKAGWSGKIRAGRDRATGLPWRSTTLPLSYSLEESAKVFAAVCSEVLGGYWRPSVRGHTVVATLQPPDDPAVVPFKEVARELAGEGTDVAIDPDGAVRVLFSQKAAAKLAHVEAKKKFAEVFTELLPADDDQSWLPEWRLPQRFCRFVMTSFPEILEHRNLINDSPPQDADHYCAELSIPVGKDTRGNRLFWPVHQRANAFICGAPGRGKTTALRRIIIESNNSMVAIANFKDGPGFDDLNGLPNVVLSTREFADNIRTFGWVASEMDRRYHDPLRKPWEHPRLLLIVDEVTDFYDAASAADKKLLASILRKGRESNIHVVLAAQNVTKDNIPSNVLTLCEHREQWGWKRETDMRVVWGEKTELAQSIVPSNVRGRGIVTAADGDPVLCQSLWPGTRSNVADLLAGLLDQVRAVTPPTYDPVVFAESAGVPPACSTWNVPPPPPPSVVDVPGDGTPGGTPGGTTVEHAVEHPMERLLADEAEAYLKAVTGKPDKRAVVIAAYRDGKTVRECADAAGVGLGTAHRWIKAYEREHGQ